MFQQHALKYIYITNNEEYMFFWHMHTISVEPFSV